MMALCLRLALCLYILQTCSASHFTLSPLSFTKLPTSVRNNVFSYGMDLGTANDGAYDPVDKVMYIIGTTSHFMHIIDVQDPSNPQTMYTYQFPLDQGLPTAVDVCGDEVAVSMVDYGDAGEGHVRYYKRYVKGSQTLVTDGFQTVGEHPEHLKYSPDCSYLVVSNEGMPKKNVLGAYYNPEGSVSIVHGERTGNPTVRLVDFNSYNYGQTNYNPDIRTPGTKIPITTHSPRTTESQDFEPEYVTVSADGKTAWVSLQENNAIAEISISQGTVNKVVPLPKKLWNTGIDTSDRDGGVHLRQYPRLQSLRMPGVIKNFRIGNKKYLFVADEGARTSYSNGAHGFTWTDGVTARSIASKISPQFADLIANASNDAYLGRLLVSSVDGMDLYGNYEYLEFFGGRGFSIWDASSMSMIFDSEGTLEEYMDAEYHNVFNTNYQKNTATYQSPENLRDSVSHLMGAQVTGLDIAEDNGTVFLVVGTSQAGTLYLYKVNTDSGQPIPEFQSITRAGDTDDPWNVLYQDERVGDLFITDLEIIPGDVSPTGNPLVYVVSTGSGSLSMYEIIFEQVIIT